MIISLIVAKGKQNQIGKNNRLLWKIKDDMENFKKITTGHCIIMGRKTFESIGRPLPNRTTLIITRNKNIAEGDSCFLFDDCYKAIEYAKNKGESELVVCGGSSIYDFFLENNLVDKIYLTDVDYDGEADRFFREINYNDWKIIEDKKFEKSERNGYSGKIITLVKNDL